MTTTYAGSPPAPDEFRNGYRQGFRDGVADAHDIRQQPGQAKQPDDSGADKGGSDDKSDDKKDGDKKDGEKDGHEKDGDDKDDGKPPLYKRPLVVLLVLAVLLAAIIGAILFWRHSKHHESTDDAFVDGQASTVSAQAPGRVTTLYVTDNQVVKAGDPLIDIDPSDIQARVDQSRAQLASAESQFAQATATVAGQRANVLQAAAATRQSVAQSVQSEADLQRYRTVEPDAVARQQVDSAEASAAVAKARVDASRSSERAAVAQVESALAQVRSANASIETARANLAAAELQLSYVHVVAPVDGRVTRRSIQVGNVISVGQALLSLVQPQMWVTANYKETQLTKMRVGQQVKIKVDAFPDVDFNGRIDSFQSGTGAYFSMLPAENATGNYVKVVQRVPVKIVFDDDRIKNYPIGPGMSVAPDVQIP